MNLSTFLRPIWMVMLFTALQVVIFRNFALWNTGFCYIYIAAVLLLQLETGAITAMLIGFFVGLLNDMFYNTPGMHAASLVFLAYMRARWIKILTPPGGYEGDLEVSPDSRGWAWYFRFVGPLVLLHHFFLFFLEYADFTMLHVVLLNAIVSSVLTIFVLVLVQMIVMPKVRLNR